MDSQAEVKIFKAFFLNLHHGIVHKLQTGDRTLVPEKTPEEPEAVQEGL